MTPAGPLFERRQSGEMVARLYDAAKIGGASPELLDELERSDQRIRVTESTQDSAERGWRTIRAAAAIPTDRASFPPHGDFFDGGLAAPDVGEFLASLERWDSAAPLNRYLAEWSAIRAVAQNGHLDLLDQPLNRFTAFVTELHSGRAMRGHAELRGFVARKRHDWVGAAHWYGQVASARDGELASWFDLAVAWHLLSARALCAGPFELTGDELRDPWQCYRNEHLDPPLHCTASDAATWPSASLPGLIGTTQPVSWRSDSPTCSKPPGSKRRRSTPPTTSTFSSTSCSPSPTNSMVGASRNKMSSRKRSAPYSAR